MVEKTQSQKYGKYIPYILILSNFIILNAVFYGTCWYRDILYMPLIMREGGLMANVALVLMTLWQRRHKDTGFRSRTMDRIVLDSMRFVITHAIIFIAMMTVLHAMLALSFYLIFYGTYMVVMLLWTMISMRIIKWARAKGRNTVRILIVGTNATGLRLAEQMRSDEGFGYRIVGFVDSDRPNGFPEKYLGTIDELYDIVRNERIDEIYFTLPGARQDDLSTVVKVADDNVIAFYYVPQISRYVSRNFDLSTIGAMPILILRHNPMTSTANRVLKRAFDIGFSSAFLLFSPLIFIPAAIAVKISSPGPVFFRQKRTGYRGRPFDCLKFRTMRVNANADNVQATENDPRKTAIGDFMRRTSIDELPQFINVWLGDMSVVGPRPHMLKHTEDYTKLVDKYMARHTVKPGITGWAQVNGYRGLTDEVWKMEKRVEHDVWYIEHWTFMLDMKIIVRTIINAITGEKNAF